MSMGRTFVDVKVENYFDVELRESGISPRKRVRASNVRALVDTGSALLCLPSTLIRKLRLQKQRTERVRTTTGVVERGVYGVARVTVMGRDYRGDVLEIPENVPVLLGFISLEFLDFVVNPKSGRLEPNPEHGGEWMLDLL